MIYSIGYGNRKINEFVELLKKFHIEYLVDIRSKPFSQYHPEYNKGLIERTLSENSIKYAFLGNELGGRPDDETCYTDGKVDYNLLEQKNFYRNGIERLKAAYEQGYDVAIMCSEQKPEECHRSKLIGATLINESIKVQHIDEEGNLEDQLTAVNKANKGKNIRNLFGELEMKSRKKYK